MFSLSSMPRPKTPESYGPPLGFPRKSLESSLRDAILSPAENAAFEQTLHWEFDQKADDRQRATNKALEALREALKKKA